MPGAQGRYALLHRFDRFGTLTYFGLGRCRATTRQPAEPFTGCIPTRSRCWLLLVKRQAMRRSPIMVAIFCFSRAGSTLVMPDLLKVLPGIPIVRRDRAGLLDQDLRGIEN